MTQQQFEHIQGLLEEWRAVRNLSVEDQKKNFKVNYTKEILELFEAERDNNEYEMIDAICDMMVVAINAGGVLGKEFGSYGTLLGVEFNVSSVLADNSEIFKLCNAIRYYGYNPYECLLETIKELNSRTGSWDGKEGKWVKHKGAYTAEGALQGFLFGIRDEDFEVRTDGDFFIVTDTHRNEEYSFKKWYKADYSKCKL